MDANGVYHGLVEAQNLRMKDEDQNKLEEDEKFGMMSQFDIIKVDYIAILEIPAFSRVRSLSEHQSHGNEPSTDDKKMGKKTDEITEVNLFIYPIPIIVSRHK